MELNKIYNCDCLSGLAQLEKESIDMVITSPPYDNLRSYDGYVFTHYYFLEVVKELYRVLKKGGVVVWIVNDETKNYSESGTSFRQALEFKELGFCLYDTMIYAKNNYTPLNHRRYEQAFEFMFIFSKGKVNQFNPIKVNCKYAGKTRSGTYRKDSSAKLKKMNTPGKVSLKKIMGNIWYYNVGNAETNDKISHNHEAIFPEKLVKDHILSWSNKEDIVLDIFMGSGTVAKVSLENNRKYIGFEVSEKNCKLAEKRVKNSMIT
ncbi:site-specific DNA-methyltransferase [Clostridium botulinum]|nr:site-specific DNA-methyltransferase [Clostridium botulinum]